MKAFSSLIFTVHKPELSVQGGGGGQGGGLEKQNFIFTIFRNTEA